LGAIASYAVRRAQIGFGQPFAVVGAGIIGALTQRLAIAAGAGPCTVIASSHSKEQRVAGVGIDRFLAVADGQDAVDAVGAPVVIEATGHADGLLTAVAAAAPWARVILLGSPRGESSILPARKIREKRLQIVGTHVCSLERELAMGRGSGINGEADVVLRMLAAGLLRVDDLFEPDVDPREAARFYLRLVNDRRIVGARFDWAGFTASGRWSAPPRRRRISARKRNPFSSAAGQVRFGMIGCGEIAVLNAEALALAPNTLVTACHDLVPELAADLAGRPRDPEALVFTAPLGGPLRPHTWVKSFFKPAVRAAGLPEGLRLYDLRHTCASLLIAQGASVKAVQPSSGTRPRASPWTPTGTCSPPSWRPWPTGWSRPGPPR
jgi:hypothetical protein